MLTLFTLRELNEFNEDWDVHIFHGMTEEFLKHQEGVIFTSSTRQMRAPPEILPWGGLIFLLLGADNPMALFPKGGRYQFIRPASIYGVMSGEAWNEDECLEAFVFGTAVCHI